MKSYKKKNCIGQSLSQTLKERGLTVTQFSEEIGLSRSLVQKYMNNTKHPTDETLQKIADYFELPTQFFLDEAYLDEEGNPTRSFDIRLENIDSFISDKMKDVNAKRALNNDLKLLNYYLDTLDSDRKIDVSIQFMNFVDSIINDKKLNIADRKTDLLKFENAVKEYKEDITNEQIIQILKNNNILEVPANIPLSTVLAAFTAGLEANASEESLLRRKIIQESNTWNLDSIFENVEDGGELYYLFNALCNSISLNHTKTALEDLSNIQNQLDLILSSNFKKSSVKKLHSRYDLNILQTLKKADINICSALFNFILHIKNKEFLTAKSDVNQLKNLLK